MRFIIEADNDDGFGAGEQFVGVDAMFEIFVHPGHFARVAGVEPAEQAVEIVGMQGGGIGDADEVEAEVEGFLLYLFSQAHFFVRKNKAGILYHLLRQNQKKCVIVSR